MCRLHRSPGRATTHARQATLQAGSRCALRIELAPWVERLPEGSESQGSERRTRTEPPARGGEGRLRNAERCAASTTSHPSNEGCRACHLDPEASRRAVQQAAASAPSELPSEELAASG